MKSSPPKKFPLGKSDFKNVIEGDYYFVDKSLLIHQIIEDDSEILLFPRPRRFGKTLNISMLRYFFEKTNPPNDHLFEKLNIKSKDTWKHQGHYPVIYLTLKDIKGENWEESFKRLKRIVSKEFSRHDYLLEASVLKPDEKAEYVSILNKTADQSAYEFSIKDLSEYLHRFYKQKVVILCDEYDSPIHNGYFHNYEYKVLAFMRVFLGSALKDNEFIFKGIITGILKIARESIFSELNNIDVYSILSEDFCEFFGITQDEIQTILKKLDLLDHHDIIEKTYDGYHFGPYTLYNPWSVTHYLAKPHAGPLPYWMNTSANLFIRELVYEQRMLDMTEVQCLIDKDVVWKRLDDNLVMRDLKVFKDAVWSLLLFNGYLTIENKRKIPGENRFEYCLRIPNTEVRNYFQREMELFIQKGNTIKTESSIDNPVKTVFISYNHKDEAFINRLKKDLEQQNIPLIIDINHMKFGDDISDFVKRSIKTSDITLAVISKNSLKSPWVMLEALETFLAESSEQRIRYIPLLIDDSIFEDHFFALLIESIEKTIDRIFDEISHLSKKYLHAEALYTSHKRFINLRSNIDNILLRLQENLVANFINDTKYKENFPKLVRLIRQ